MSGARDVTSARAVLARDRGAVDGGRRAARTARGLDLGTSGLRAAERADDGACLLVEERNAFLELPADVAMEPRALTQLDVAFARWQERLWVLGDASYNLANLFVGGDVRRPLRDGFLAPHDGDALAMLGCLVERVLGTPRHDGELVAFSVPGPPVEGGVDAAAHEARVARLLEALGYRAIAVDEGLAAVLAELDERAFTGVALSCGAGATSVCVAHEARALTTFSLARGGDWIDRRVAEVLGIDVARARALKEGGVDLRAPSGREQVAVALCTRLYVSSVLRALEQHFGRTDELPRFSGPLDVVLVGGTSRSRGIGAVFAEELRKFSFPLRIGAIECAPEPGSAVARGCLLAALLAAD